MASRNGDLKKSQVDGEMANETMSKVRQQVSTLLGAARNGELPALKAFLSDFAAQQLRGEREQYGVAPDDESDDDAPVSSASVDDDDERSGLVKH